jgi:hypothetical protein
VHSFKQQEGKMGNTRCPDAATSGFYNKLSFGWMNNVVKSARKGE